MWRWLRRNGATEAELAWFEANATPPDVIGVNHYLTSDRYLLTGVANCPPEWHWHDAERTYVDVEAIRVDEQYPIDMATALSDAWERYRLPVAVTEAHLGCTRDEQVRWLHESWQGAQRLRAAGADVRAVTAWSLLGSYDWNSLVTRDDGFYEPGVFDVRAPEPRPTALAKLMRQLASGQQADHPVLDVPGWWHRPHRTWDAQAAGRTICFNRGLSSDWHEVTGGRPLLITGATGTLGRAFARICDTRGLPHHLLGREELDLASGQPFGGVLGSIRPWAVINAAGYVRVDDAETAEEHCRAANVAGPAQLAAACAERGIRLVTFSSDLVFDGRQRHPYSESSPIAPLNAYGRSKAEMERRVLAALPDALVVRTSAFFGPWDEYNFVTQALRALSRHEQFLAADDCTISPTYVPDLVNASLDLLIDGESGLWHLANQGAVTWADLARLAARAADVPTSSLVTRPMAALGLPAPRPLYSVLASERGWIMPPLEDALRRCLHWLDLPVRDESLAA